MEINRLPKKIPAEDKLQVSMLISGSRIMVGNCCEIYSKDSTICQCYIQVLSTVVEVSRYCCKDFHIPLYEYHISQFLYYTGCSKITPKMLNCRFKLIEQYLSKKGTKLFVFKLLSSCQQNLVQVLQIMSLNQLRILQNFINLAELFMELLKKTFFIKL